MIVTVIIIIAVIVVLAVLVLLLLGMRALSMGSREEDFDFEGDRGPDHEGYDDEEEEEEEPAPRERTRRSRQGGKERRPKKRREAEWANDSDSLSDNDFWSSLSETGPAQQSSDSFGGRGGRDTPADGYDYGYEGYDDYGYEGYEDYDEREGYDHYDEPLPREPKDDQVPRGVPSPLSSGGGTGSNLAALADLGQSSGPQQPYAHDPEPPLPAPRDAADTPKHALPAPTSQSAPQSAPQSALPPTQGLPPAQPAAPAAGASYEDHPLGSGSWFSSGDQSPRGADDPLGEPSDRSRGPLRDPLGVPGGAPGAPNPGQPHGDPPGGFGSGSRSSYDSGALNRSDYRGAGVGEPSSSSAPGNPLDREFRPSTDPLDPGFRPAQASPSDMSSPIWSSLDTGAHQRPDPSELRNYGASAASGQGSAPGQSGPGGAPLGAGQGNTNQGPYGPGQFGHPPSGGPGPSGTGVPPTGAPNPSAQQPYPGYDTGTHHRSPYDSGTHSRPNYGAPTHPAYGHDPYNRPEYDTGTHQRSPYDSGTHSRPGYSPNAPLWAGQTDPGPFGAPGAPPGHFGADSAAPPPGTGQPSPYDSGTHSRPTYQDSHYPTNGAPFPGHYQGYPVAAPPTGGYPADQLRGEAPGYDGWAPPREGAQQQGPSGPQPPYPYQQDPYAPRGYYYPHEQRFEGDYEDGYYR